MYILTDRGCLLQHVISKNRKEKKIEMLIGSMEKEI